MNHGRVKKRRIDELVAWGSGQQKLATTHRESQAHPGGLTVDPGAPLLHHVAQDLTIFEFNRTEPSFFEAFGERINFYTPDETRPGVHAYRMKFDADESSLEGFVNTTKKLFQKSNGYIATAYIEFQPADVATRHMKHFRKETSLARPNNPLGSHARAPARAGSAHARQLVASAAREGQEAEGQEGEGQEGEVQMDDVCGRCGKSSHQHDVCAHCGKQGHTVELCAVPSRNYGSIGACPVCNTKDHYFDECPHMAAKDPGDAGFMREVLESVLRQRANRPQIRSTLWAWPDVLAICDNLGLIEDRDEVLVWPWRNSFAKAIAQSHRNAAILGGSKHPQDFVPCKDEQDNLPADPLFLNKSIRDILTMRLKGELRSDTFVPQDENLALNAPANIARLVQQAMGAVGAFDAQNRLKSRADISAELRKIKAETTDDGTVPTVARFSKVRRFTAINTGAFPDECTILGDQPHWGLKPAFKSVVPQFQAPNAFRDQVLEKVRKFYLEPYEPFDVRDLVFKRLYEVHKEADEQSQRAGALCARDPVADLEGALADAQRRSSATGGPNATALALGGQPNASATPGGGQNPLASAGQSVAQPKNPFVATNASGSVTEAGPAATGPAAAAAIARLAPINQAGQTAAQPSDGLDVEMPPAPVEPAPAAQSAQPSDDLDVEMPMMELAPATQSAQYRPAADSHEEDLIDYSDDEFGIVKLFKEAKQPAQPAP
jgi:hypothetical protein